MSLEKYLWKYLLKQGVRVEEQDRHCFACGSCRYYDFTYQSQLEGKTQWVKNLYAEGLEYPGEIAAVPAPKMKYYRGRMDFITSKGMIGMRRSGGFANVYNVEESCIFDENVGKVLAILRTFKTYPDYDLYTHEGVIRYIVIRKTEHNGTKQFSISVVLNTIPDTFAADFEAFLKENNLWEYFTVVCLINQPSVADVSYGEVTAYIKGDVLLQDITVNEKTYVFSIAPQSFFQANVSVFEKVLTYMNAKLGDKKYSHLYDLYGGTGTIGLVLASHAQKLTMAENNLENTVLFQENCKHNRVENSEIFVGTVSDFIEQKEFAEDSIAIFDPPRSGIEKKVAEAFIKKEHLPEKILYMSCNPASQVEDIKILLEKYTLDEVQVFDMFPYASHVESVAVLTRKF